MTRRLAGVALTLGWLVLLALPAAARPTDSAITAPEAKAVLTSAVEIAGWVDRTTPPPPGAPGPQEQDDLMTRLLDAEGKVIGEERALELVEITDTGPGTQRMHFRGVLDPFALAWTPEPAVAPNGGYTLQAQWRLSYGDYEERPDEWRSVPITLNVPPPATTAVAGVKDADAFQIQVAWRPIEVPDLVGYRLEVSSGAGPWRVAVDEIDPNTSSTIHVADGYGVYRYRVVTRRAAADGAALESVSEPTQPVGLAEDTAPQPVDDGVDDSADDAGDDGSTPTPSGGAQAPPPLVPEPLPSATPPPGVEAPPGANESFEPLIDYGVDVTGERTERVPIDPPDQMAAPAGSGDPLSVGTSGLALSQGTMQGIAGGMVLLVAAGHVMRFLNA